MTVRRLKRTAQAAATLAASIFFVMALAPSPAQAQNNYHAWVWAQNPAGTYNAGVAEIRSYGENILVEDFHPDGWGVRAQLQTLEWAPEGYRYWKNHGGVCFDDTSRGNTARGATVCDRNVAEGQEFRVHIWASQSGSTKWHHYSPSIPA
ncbi:hypothetical protein LO763_10180 [Glycomyces sp. A-F 0318]|uniref:hypothetical protein n=1 Tax=Glycomyces amatae TaxID=2881355 RepID=UPI001E64EFB9|nr:hypothetical protein [Glycomyces amatae]MCD0443991.1 hypothetical protein [Glycomyces amatae]